jgi:hypothetical protein
VSATFIKSPLRRSVSHIVSSHEAFFETLIRLSYTAAVVHIKASQSINLVMQMSIQWFREILDQAPDLMSVVVFGETCLNIFLELIEPRCKSSVLLDIAFHDAFDIRYLLYAWEEHRFFGIVVVVHGFTPTLTVGEEVSNRS